MATSRRGTVAVEFAFLSTALVMLVMGILHVGFCLYAQVVLDKATLATAILFQTDKGKTIGDPSKNGVTSQTVCLQLQGLLDCGAIKVQNYKVTDYKANTGPGSSAYDPGGSRTTMLLVLTYTAPIPTWPVLPGNSSPMVITSAVPYVNEF